ncbi:mechanosensitive ion channel family protein [Marivita hallyeonensis]|uniref:MscS family membrane protein n=1 Tax=Marivita hallyeonensis TaxID=996342 RepID=A0A1M5S3M4_9RHOB|nr:mechanosensitive ion channel family protein [Marivita hallyeonensis]SHH33079.1 MscS family membrane protein [Marivita hallyeonensis]
MRLVLVWLLICVTGFVGNPTLAQAQMLPLSEEPVTSDEPAFPLDTAGRETPRGLVTGLVQAMSDEDHQRVALYLETPNRIADFGFRQFHILRIETALNAAARFETPAELSIAPEGVLDDGLAPMRERVGTLTVADMQQPLLANRTTLDGIPVWRISAETVEILLDWRSSTVTGLGTVQEFLLGLPSGPSVFGISARDAIILIGFAALSLGLSWALLKVRRLVSRVVRRGRMSTRFSRFIEVSEPPLQLLIASLIFTAGISYLGVSMVARFQVVWIVELAAWLAAIWFVWRLIDTIGEAVLASMSRRGAASMFSAVSFFTRILKAILIVVSAAFALRALGFDITAGLAALGVGGLALALGAQKLIENLVGSVSLIADRPIRVGDFCRFGQTLGTIEEIGIRSTRIRTLDRTIVTVPNGEFSSLHLENFSRRDQFLLRHTIDLRYETDARQIKAVLSGLRDMLVAHPRLVEDTPRVRFIGYGAYSLDIEMFGYVRARDWNEFLEIQEALLIDVMHIVEGTGTGFAFPTQTVYLGNDDIRPLLSLKQRAA